MKIDQEKINEIKALEEEVGEQVLEDLVEIYLTSIPEFLDSMRLANEARDFDSIRRIAHSMKSTTINLGVNEMADVCYKLEKSPPQTTYVQFLDQIESLKKMFEESKPLVMQLVEKWVK